MVFVLFGALIGSGFGPILASHMNIRLAWHREDIYSYCIRPLAGIVISKGYSWGLSGTIGALIIKKLFLPDTGKWMAFTGGMIFAFIFSYIAAYRAAKNLYPRNVAKYERELNLAGIVPKFEKLDWGTKVESLKSVLPGTEMEMHVGIRFLGSYVARDLNGRMATVTSGMTITEFIQQLNKAGVKFERISESRFCVGKTIFHFANERLSEKEDVQG